MILRFAPTLVCENRKSPCF